MAALLPNGKQQFEDANGNPLVAGTVQFYVPNTTTPKSTWQNAAQTILNTNPVVLDGSGQAVIYGAGQYRQIVKDALGNTIWDQITNSQSAGLLTYTSEFCVGGGTVDDTAAFQAAVAAAGTGTLVVDQVVRLTANQAVGCSLQFINGGQVKPDAGVTVTANGYVSADLMARILSGSGSLVFGASGAAEASTAWFGGAPGGSTDCAAAINAALSSGASSVKLPGHPWRCSAGITVPPGVNFFSDAFIPGNPTTSGASLIFDLSVATCVTLAGGSNQTQGLRGIAITRAAGAIPAGSKGVLVTGTFNPILQDVYCFRHDVGFQFDNVSAALGINARLTRLYTGIISDAHIVFDSWPGAMLDGCLFGQDGGGDLRCNTFLRIQGGSNTPSGIGPNTLFFSNCQFNQGANQPISGIQFNAVLGAGTNAIEYKFSNCHWELCDSLITSDSGTASITNFQMVNCTYNTSGPFCNLNAATAINNWSIIGTDSAGSFVAAPTAQINGLNIISCQFLGAVSITGAASSTACLSGNKYAGGLTVAGGFWASFKDTGSQFLAGGISVTATGNVSIDNPGTSAIPFVPGIAIGGSATGITYSSAAGGWQLQGNRVTVTFIINLSSKGTGTGAVTLTGLPRTSSSAALSGGGGGALSFTGAMASLTSGVAANVTPSATTAILYQAGTTGSVALTNANLTNASQIYGTFDYFI